MVAHCCGRAGVAGVRRGMTVAQARALCAGLTVHEQPAAPEEDEASLRRLARWMLRFSPIVSLDRPDGLLLDIAGCEALFGGEREHVRRISAVLQRWGFRPRLAVAPTFSAARAVARFGESAVAHVSALDLVATLGRLPVHALWIDERTAAAMADVGIERIEHLLALPRGDLAARFGAPLLRRLDQAVGAVRESIRPIREAVRFEASREFDGPVKCAAAIALATRELLNRLFGQLRARHLGILELGMQVRRVDLDPQELLMRLTCPSGDPGHLWKLLEPRLERVHLGYGVTGVVLRAVRTGRIRPAQGAFLREAMPHVEQSADFGELVDHLVDRLGAGAVTRVRAAEAYLPEQAYTHAAAGEFAAAGAADVPVHAACRPSQLLGVPERAGVLSLVPDGPPVRVDWRGCAAEVVASIGPERILPPWWSEPVAASRDYYEAEDAAGRRLWIYRDGATGGWFVHGQWV